MKLAVIGANGRTGQAFVAAALAAGHEVRAGIHRHNPFHAHARLHVVRCDATNPQHLAHLIRGQDAVISLIGHVKGSAPSVQANVTLQLVQVMGSLGLRRLISLTGTGARLPGDRITLIDRLMNFAVGRIDSARVADGRQHVAVLQGSSLDWTVVRVLKLTNSPAHPFTLQPHGPAQTFVSRHEVAAAILQLLAQNTFVREAPIIGPTRVR